MNRNQASCPATKEIMKFLFLTSGRRTPSTRFRMLPFEQPLRNAGHVCHLAHSFPEKYDYFPWLGFRPSQWLKRLTRRLHLLRTKWGRYDVVVLERELFDNASWDLEADLRRMTKTLVLDIDDGVFLKFPDKFARLLEMVDLVVVGNPLLEQWARTSHEHVVVIPTCIDTTAYQPRAVARAANVRPVIGWMGTAGNIVYLKVLAEALRNLARIHDFEFQVIATHRGMLDELELDGVRVRFRPWNPETEAADIRDFDIGVMPLSDDQWSRYKCGLKLLQYMAVGIPGVASPVGVNASIVTPGVDGYLANRAEEWEAALAGLLEDAALRQAIGLRARQTVVESYSIAANLPRWLAAVQQTVERTAGAG